MTKQERQEYNLYIQSIYDEYLWKTEKRSISYGELNYIESLKIKQLKEIEKELLEVLNNDK